MVDKYFFWVKSIDTFFHTPVWDHWILDWQLAICIPLLLIARFLPRVPRSFLLLFYSFVFIGILASVKYFFLFITTGLVFYYLHYWLQNKSYRSKLSWIVVALMIAAFFLFLDWPALQSPWTGSKVHAFGISYTLFRWMAFTVDVGRGMPVSGNPLEFMSYAFFYPTFFQGPIDRYQDFRENNLHQNQSLDFSTLSKNILRIAGGILKGWVAKKFFDLDWVHYFNYPQDLSYGYLWWGMYARAISFYLLVSACNDLSIASCRLGGFKVPENYNFPYFRRNLAEFWRNWHMSLMRILREYIYIPLGGNRRHVYFNYLLIFMLVAMWHVTSEAFVIWGLMHGLGMCVFRGWKQFWKRVEENPAETFLKKLQNISRRFPKITYVFSMLITFHFVAFAWLPFWGGHPQGLSMILRLLSGNHWHLFVW